MFFSRDFLRFIKRRYKATDLLKEINKLDLQEKELDFLIRQLQEQSSQPMLNMISLK